MNPYLNKKAIVSKRGQWDYPGQDTIVPTPDGSITMQGVNYPVYGQDETGYGQMMYPNKEYKFPGKMVYETPMMSVGGIASTNPVDPVDPIEAEKRTQMLQMYNEELQKAKNKVSSDAFKNKFAYEGKMSGWNESEIEQERNNRIANYENIDYQYDNFNDLFATKPGARGLIEPDFKYSEMGKIIDPNDPSKGYALSIEKQNKIKAGINPSLLQFPNIARSTMQHEFSGHVGDVASPNDKSPLEYYGDNKGTPFYAPVWNHTPFALQTIKENTVSHPYYSMPTEVKAGKRQVENLLENAPIDKVNFNKAWKYGDDVSLDHFKYIINPQQYSDNPNDFKNEESDMMLKSIYGEDRVKKGRDFTEDEINEGYKKFKNLMILAQNQKSMSNNNKNSYAITAKNGAMIKRADGSYSERGLWDNIRANKGSGNKPTEQMLKQEKKIKQQEMQSGGKANPYLQAQGGTQTLNLQGYNEIKDAKPKYVTIDGKQVKKSGQEYKDAYDSGDLMTVDYDGVPVRYSTEEAVVTAEAPAFLKQQREIEKDPIAHAVREGRNAFAMPFLELTGAPGIGRFLKDPMKNLKGAYNVVSDFSTPQLAMNAYNYMQGNPFFNFSNEDLEGLANTADVFGVVAPFAKPISKGLSFAPRLLGKVPKININTGLRFADESIDAAKALQQTDQNVINSVRQPQLAANTTQAVAKEYTPWAKQEMPGLHIKSTMTGSPFEKQLSKTGELNVSNIQAHINKADVSSADKFTLQKVLDEKFAGKQKVDYNDFRKAVQEEAVTLERNIVADDQWANYGVGRIGYPGLKPESYKSSIQNIIDESQYYNSIKNAEKDNMIKVLDNGEEKYLFTDRFGREQAIPSDQIDRFLSYEKSQADDFFKNTYPKKAEYEKLLSEMPETKTYTYQNIDKFGKGSPKHYNDATLAHTRTMVTKEEPNVAHILEQQSDYWQSGAGKNPVKIDYEKWNPRIEQMEKQLAEDLANLEHMKKYKEGLNGSKMDDYSIKQFEESLKAKERDIRFNKGEMANPEQKEFLGKAHQERLLQENVQYAAEQGKQKVRYPTRETAAKTQGYSPVKKALSSEEIENLNGRKRGLEFAISEHYATYGDDPIYKDIVKRFEEELAEINKYKYKPGKDVYADQHETILRKYDDTPKMIQKTLGVKVNTVTDAKGNTWYEFDIPDAYKQGKAEIKAYSMPGIIGGGAATAAGASQLNKETQQKRFGGNTNPYLKARFGANVKSSNKKVNCACGWSWDISDGGSNPYKCHKCGNDNSYAKGQDGLEANLPEAPTNMFSDYNPVSDDYTAAMTGMMKARMATDAEFGNDAAKRLTSPFVNPYTFTGNERIYGEEVGVPAGATGTHFMSSMGQYAVPFIQQKQDGSLYFNENASPSDLESMKFETESDAEYFSNENYKKVAPLMTNWGKYKKGGESDLVPVEVERSERIYDPKGNLLKEIPADAPTHEEGGVKLHLRPGTLVFPKKYYKALDAASGLPEFNKIKEKMLDNAEKAYLRGEPYSSGGRRS